jgi:repressor LexA
MSPVQEKILQHFHHYFSLHGEAPTLAELGEKVGIKSRGTMHRHINALIALGKLEKSPKHWRGLKPAMMDELPIASLPLAGNIAAGLPIQAIEGQDTLDLGQLLCQPGRYALRIIGDSMIDMALHDGDYVIIESRSHASNGQVVVALIDREEATLKRFYDQGDGMIELRPENTDMESMYFKAERVTIQGVLVGLTRVYN